MKAICFGELIVDFTGMESGVPLWETRKFQKNIGGAPANVAIGLKHHGVDVQLWSKVGKDTFGKFLVHQIQRLGISSDGIVQDNRHPTKLAFVGLDEQGERYFEFHNLDSAECHIRIQDIHMEQLKTAHLFHFGGVALMGDVTAQTTLTILKNARENACLVSFDPNIRLNLVKNREAVVERLHQVLQYVDILKMSIEDLHNIFPGKTARDFLSSNTVLVVITEGRRGACFLTQKQEVFVPARPIKTVDTTGAGDAFTAALLARIIELPGEFKLSEVAENKLRQWGQFAHHWAAKIIAHRGAVTGYSYTQ